MKQLSHARSNASGSERELSSPNSDNTQELSLVDWTENLVVWAKGLVADWDKQARHTMRTHPVLSLIGAFTFGSAAGRVLSRK